VDVITLSDEEEIIGETKHSYWSAFDKKKNKNMYHVFSANREIPNKDQ